MPEPYAALVDGEIRVTKFAAQPIEFVGVAGGAGEASEKFLQKLRCGFASEGESEDTVRGLSTGEEFETAGDKAVSFAAAGIRHDEEDAGDVFHGRPSK